MLADFKNVFTVGLSRERPLLKMNGDILLTQQRSNGVRYERKKSWLAYVM